MNRIRWAGSRRGDNGEILTVPTTSLACEKFSPTAAQEPPNLRLASGGINPALLLSANGASTPDPERL